MSYSKRCIFILRLTILRDLMGWLLFRFTAPCDPCLVNDCKFALRTSSIAFCSRSLQVPLASAFPLSPNRCKFFRKYYDMIRWIVYSRLDELTKYMHLLPWLSSELKHRIVVELSSHGTLASLARTHTPYQWEAEQALCGTLQVLPWTVLKPWPQIQRMLVLSVFWLCTLPITKTTILGNNFRCTS